MSLHSIRRCDECGVNQGATNHWWAIVGSPYAPQFMTSRRAKNFKGKFRLDKCSHKCVTTAFNRWLDTGDVRKKRVEHPAPVAKAVDAVLAEIEDQEEYARLIP